MDEETKSTLIDPEDMEDGKYYQDVACRQPDGTWITRVMEISYEEWLFMQPSAEQPKQPRISDTEAIMMGLADIYEMLANIRSGGD